jgi:hypothetical protein
VSTAFPFSSVSFFCNMLSRLSLSVATVSPSEPARVDACDHAIEAARDHGAGEQAAGSVQYRRHLCVDNSFDHVHSFDRFFLESPVIGFYVHKVGCQVNLNRHEFVGWYLRKDRFPPCPSWKCGIIPCTLKSEKIS